MHYTIQTGQSPSFAFVIQSLYNFHLAYNIEHIFLPCTYSKPITDTIYLVILCYPLTNINILFVHLISTSFQRRPFRFKIMTLFNNVVRILNMYKPQKPQTKFSIKCCFKRHFLAAYYIHLVSRLFIYTIFFFLWSLAHTY